MLDTTLTPRIDRRLMFRWEESQHAWLLLYPEGVIKLNAVAGDILRRCDGSRTIATLLDEIVTSFDAPEQTVRDGSLQFLNEAFTRGWLVS